MRIVPATRVLQDLRADAGSGIEGGKGISMNTRMRDRVCLAYIMQEAIKSLARGEDLLKALWSSYVAAQHLELGILTKADVMEQYCTCLNSEMRSKTEHLCMSCYTAQLCASMRMRDTEHGTLVECAGCSSQTASSHRMYNGNVGDEIRRRLSAHQRNNITYD